MLAISGVKTAAIALVRMSDPGGVVGGVEQRVGNGGRAGVRDELDLVRVLVGGHTFRGSGEDSCRDGVLGGVTPG